MSTRSKEEQNLLGRLLAVSPHGLDGEGRRELLQAAAARSRRSSRGALGRLRANGWPLVQTAIAAALSWSIASRLLGDPSPFFAPVAAITALAATRGQRMRRAVEVIIGVALGIALGDLMRRYVGVGEWQLALMVGLAMAATVALGAGRLMLTEAAVSASLVATVSVDTLGFPPTRLLDALVGGAVALVFSQLLFPVKPLEVVREAVESVLDEIAQTLNDVADALDARDLHEAEAALLRARRVGEDWSRFEQALDVAREAAQYAPPRRQAREPLDTYRQAGLPLDLMVRDIHVVARGAVRALTICDRIPEKLTDALRALAGATRDLVGELANGTEGDRVRSVALSAAHAATELAPDAENLSLSVLIGYVQATAADLLRALGTERQRAHAEIGDAARAAGG